MSEIRKDLIPAGLESELKDNKPEKPGDKSILIVDDDSVLRTLYGRILGRPDAGLGVIQIETCASVREAIGKIDQGMTPDGILSDVMMPEMTGADFYRWLGEHRQELTDRIGFLSGGVQGSCLQDFVVSMNKQGRFLWKPADRQNLVRFASGILGKK